jgi:GAF domain-containing protein
MSEFLCRDVRTTLGEMDVQHLALWLATRVLQSGSAAVWLLQPDQSLRSGAAVGYPAAPDSPTIPLNEQLTRQACIGVVNLADARVDSLLAHASVALLMQCSYLGVPIQRHGASLGALEVIGPAGGPFTSRDESLLICVASGMAIGVTTAREASELDQEERRMAAVLEQRRY